MYKASTIARDHAINYFNSIGVRASGLLTGQDCCKTQAEGRPVRWTDGNYEGNLGTIDGGCVDNPFRWCDNVTNKDPDVPTFTRKAFADMTVRTAFDNNAMSSSNNVVYKPKPPASESSKRSLEK